ncbi:TonB-dependent receptor plug domain-containing protein [Prolixibacteraceae bacterium Z1-6]|uniref:TonB-dependent receptor plug domain-containing protein n=1 Tax=Draconibacterium aestuarii TaxID=2998507 RepID=A0A9X3F9V5_9BACT|nr:TonB-dependent receptor plug domain-containing protein [Prolixibacteraceae bacterium Z1-6]
MNYRLYVLFLFLGAVFMQPANAQKREVIGKVTTFHTIPLHKVSIVAKSMEKEVLTDENGCFAFTCDDSEKVSFIAQGFFTEKIKISDIPEQDSLHVDLRFKNGKKNFEVATGYGYISEKQLTYAIEHLNAGPDYSNYNSILEAIQGRVSGVQVSNSAINIRGTTTLDGGPTPALLVVDGTIVEFAVFANIPTTQIKSIDVIKGGAASARYGSRGMGGVVVVKTKTQN